MESDFFNYKSVCKPGDDLPSVALCILGYIGFPFLLMEIT